MKKRKKPFFSISKRQKIERDMVALFLSAFNNAGDVNILITAKERPYVGNGGIIEFSAFGESNPRFFIVHTPRQAKKALTEANYLQSSVTQKLQRRLRKRNVKAVP